MKITMAQMRVKALDFSANIERMKRIIELYKEDSDIIVFPELCISGSGIGDKFFDSNIIDELMRLNEYIKSLSSEVGIIWGNVYKENNKLYNAAFFAYDGQWVEHSNGFDAGLYFKHALTNESNSNESRYFTSGFGEYSPFEFKDQKISIIIGNDLIDYGDYSATESVLIHEPNVLINITSSPWNNKAEEIRDKWINHHYLEIPFVYVNQVGIQNTGHSVLVYDGASKAVYKDIQFQLQQNFEEDIDTVDITNLQDNRDEIKNKQYLAIIKAIQYFDEEVFPFKPNWIIGLSGGLDSSVNAGLLVKALGSKRVIGTNLPSKFNTETTKSNARNTAHALDIEYYDIPIEGMVNATVESMHKIGIEPVEGLALENIQARLRGHTLMTLSSLKNGIIINNGNKIEAALGYATLYGDAIGALSTLADLTKLEVGEMGLIINEEFGKEVVPTNLIPSVSDEAVIFETAPSAELSSGQTDPMKWGYHDAIVTFLMEYSVIDLMKLYKSKAIYNTLLGDRIKHFGLDDPTAFIDDLEWVMNQMRIATYKRIQFPPIVTVSAKAFGSGIIEAQLPKLETEEYKNLKAEILGNKIKD